MFFSVAKFLLAHTRNKFKQVKTFVQCSLLEKLPWNANVVGMSSFCFFFVIFGQEYQWWKLCFFLVFFGQGYQWWKFWLVLVIFGLGYQPRKFLFFMDIFDQGYFYWPHRLRIPMVKVMLVIWHFEQPLAPRSAKGEFAFAGGNLWHPTVQAGVRAPGGWNGFASTSILVHR